MLGRTWVYGMNSPGYWWGQLDFAAGPKIELLTQDGLPLGGALHHVRFTRAGGGFTAQEQERAGLLARRLGLSVELAR